MANAEHNRKTKSTTKLALEFFGIKGIQHCLLQSTPPNLHLSSSRHKNRPDYARMMCIGHHNRDHDQILYHVRMMVTNDFLMF